MTRKLQLLRGTTAQNDAFTGSAGELTVDTTLNQLRTHDGSTAGGHKVAKDADVVHKSDTETISGAKTFSGQTTFSNSSTYSNARTVFKDTTNAIGTYNSSAWSGTMIQFQDKDGKRIARMQPMFVSGTNILQMGMYASNDNSTEQGIYVRNDGLTSAPTPTTTNQTSHTAIATTGWVNTVGNGVMHLSGAETANGNKTFTGNITTTGSTPIHYFQSTDMDITSSGWANGRNTIAWCKDKNGHESGGVYNIIESDSNEIYTGVYVMSRKTGTAKNAHLRIKVDGSGNGYATCPASDKDGSILTTVSKSKTQKGYVKLGNGIIIQWGFTGTEALPNPTTITFPYAFSSDTSFSVVAVGIGGSTQSYTDGVQSQTSTGFSWMGPRSGTQSDNACRWIAIGY